MRLLSPFISHILASQVRYCTLCSCHKTDSFKHLGDLSWMRRQRRTYSVCNKWRIHTLNSRGLICLKGKDVIPFLQGLITNDVSHLGSGERASYSMMLNVQGRVLYDMILYGLSKENEVPCIFLEHDKRVTSELITLMKRYKIRKKVAITDVSDEYSSFAGLPAQQTENVTWLPGNNSEVIFAAPDPRLEHFGWRIIAPNEKTITSGLQPDVSVEFIPEKDYHISRYKHGIPEGIADLPPGNCLPLESNLVFLNGVSFTKGCYIGQELTARTHHTGVTRKRLLPLQFSSEPKNVAAGSNIESETGKAVGKFRNAVECFGIGLLRLAQVKQKLHVTSEEGKSYSVTTHIPTWWPEESEVDVRT